jgi:uncharacterized protein
MSTDNATPTDENAPRWRPLSPLDRRVAGVLVEKAKTTPDAYPLSLNGVVTGCNQKSNRWPMMNLEPDDVEESLDRLREMGAVGLIQGSGRVQKYRHYLYDWLGVDKVEMAVMAELLLRGPQTEGELRGRASRMEPIRDLSDLRTVLNSLKAKGLIVPLTPEGRGHVVAHALYPPKEFERIKAEHASGAAAAPSGPADEAGRSYSSPSETASPSHAADAGAADALRHEIQELRDQLAQLRSDLDDLATAQRQTADELERLRSELGP